MTYIAVKNPIFHSLFMTMCPTYAFIDRATGYFNKGMDFKKDYVALLSVGHDHLKLCSEYIENPDDESYYALETNGVMLSKNTTPEEDHEEREETLQQILENNILKLMK